MNALSRHLLPEALHLLVRLLSTRQPHSPRMVGGHYGMASLLFYFFDVKK